jgi:hypothetical protein
MSPFARKEVLAMGSGRVGVLGAACALLALVAGGCGESVQRAPAESATGPAAPPAAVEPAAAIEPRVDEEAVATFRRAAEFVRAQESFSVRIDSSFQAVQEGGEKLDFAASRTVLVRRPDRFRIDVTPGAGSSRVVQFDGKLLTVLDVGENAYAQVERVGDNDSTLRFLRGVLATPVPLAELLGNDPGGAIGSALESGYRVREERVDGVPCDHLFLRRADVDAQLWIAQGDAPLLRKVVIVYRTEPGSPEFRATLSEWQLGVEAPEQRFAFVAPAGAARIPFAVPPKPQSSEEAQP